MRSGGVERMRRNIKLILEYDGAAFFGFQRQPKHPTIQEHLEKALSQLFNRKMKISAAAGRTDSGVHAKHQVVNFYVGATRRVAPPLEQIQKGLNGILPKQIAVKSVQEVSANFHARYGAKSKTYEYLVWNHPVRSPLLLHRAHHVSFRLDLKKMRLTARFLMGRRDFRSFCAADPARKNGKAADTMRTIRKFEIKKEGDLLRFRVQADGFLYHMVRNLVGTLLEVGRGKIAPEEVQKILLAKDRRKAGPTAPSTGLTLVNVSY